MRASASALVLAGLFCIFANFSEPAQASMMVHCVVKGTVLSEPTIDKEGRETFDFQISSATEETGTQFCSMFLGFNVVKFVTLKPQESLAGRDKATLYFEHYDGMGPHGIVTSETWSTAPFEDN